MTTFVLVAGSWLGGWVWTRVRTDLEQVGHRVLAPSLTGLGDRHHVAGPDTGLSVHVKDIAHLLEWEDIHDAVLVGHSYGGMVITGASALVGDRISHIAYVDAFAPRTGQSAFDLLPWLREAFVAPAGGPDWAVAPMDFGPLGVPDLADQQWLANKATPMPRRTHEEPLEPGSDEVLARTATTYIHCAALPVLDHIAKDAADRGFRMVTLPDSGHMPMVTHPAALTTELLAIPG